MSWQVERGIGETRAIRLEGGAIAEARLDWGDRLAAGLVAEARLVSRRKGAIRGVAEFPDGSLALVDRLPAAAGEGAMLRLEVLRPALAEQGRGKLARARPTGAALRSAPTLTERLAEQGHEVREVARFAEGAGAEGAGAEGAWSEGEGGDGGWNTLLFDAFAGELGFAGGTLLLVPTPAMTLIDIDGDLPPGELARLACAQIARALRKLDIGGSIGIDFPTLQTRSERRAVDEALAASLGGWPHERTAINGFGFVQLVARLDRVPILHRARLQRVGTAARLLLRRAERLDGAGAIAMTVHPALEAHLKPAWLDELSRRSGRELRLQLDPGLAIEAPQAQLVMR